MERLTRPTVKVDETAAKYMAAPGSIPADLRSMNDRLLDLVINGPTLNGVNKDVLRQLIRQLYAELKLYEDTGYGHDEICDLAVSKATAETIVSQYEQLEKEGHLVVLPCKVGTPVYTTRWWDEVPETCIDSKGKKFQRMTAKHKVTKEEFSPFSLDYVQFGEKVFLTREEAERALEGGSDHA